jgi:ferredoxin
MKSESFDTDHTKTLYVKLDTHKCKACWKCIDSCSNQVIHKINLPFHKHVKIAGASACSGCLKCLKVCEYGAFTKVDKVEKIDPSLKMKIIKDFLINNFILIAGILTIYSGLALQIGFHMADHKKPQNGRLQDFSGSLKYEQMREIDTNKKVLGFKYFEWSSIHKFVIVLFTVFMIYHIYIHWKWYKTVLKKNLMMKNQISITLTLLFLLVALTGIIPWIVDAFGITSTIRLAFIEIHDKITFLLIIYMIIHIIKKNKWFLTTYEKIRL